MKRGDLVTVSLSGDFGKPRPALVIQSDLFADHPTVTILPLTSTPNDDSPLLRVAVEPSAGNGLKKPSWVMLDKVATSRREKLSVAFGSLEAATLSQVSRALGTFLGVTH
ncbi:type II toxin-antitoxin system PemK/MazF family toxin [Halomonas sp. PR-M31]|uniref:type II toxin-antitoxin system PemK/MazF family toxin n=1 Tax=Halomonas sp. PR-M31 TaxID=1471202 RepID=UPI0006505D04|nr:type II toxin-antitoxin system PemK/MazF family toxin [Halomonas sp. PR-M31]